MVRDDIIPLKTLDGIVITTDNDMTNTMNNYYFITVFTIEQLNNVPRKANMKVISLTLSTSALRKYRRNCNI